MIGPLVAYCSIAGLLTWLLIDARVRWQAKATAILVAPAVALILWLAWPQPAGWPTHAHPPRDAAFVWASIDEPDPQTGDRGAIYLWLATDDRTVRPRAYVLPYSRQLHQEAQDAMDSVKRGRAMRYGPTRPTGAHGARGARGAHARGRARGFSGARVEQHFYPQPTASLPPKTKP